MQTQTIDKHAAWRWVALGVVALAIAVVAYMAWGPERATEPPAELSLGESSALASCLQFDLAILSDMEQAFEGTATAVDGSTVSLSVDRWFKGGDAAAVNLIGDQQSPALIAGFEFVPGEQYLIAATNGTVNYCGYSGPASGDLLASYEAAFAG